jgi:hypothetical protein
VGLAREEDLVRVWPFDVQTVVSSSVECTYTRKVVDIIWSFTTSIMYRILKFGTSQRSIPVLLKMGTTGDGFPTSQFSGLIDENENLSSAVPSISLRMSRNWKVPMRFGPRTERVVGSAFVFVIWRCIQRVIHLSSSDILLPWGRNQGHC